MTNHQPINIPQVWINPFKEDMLSRRQWKANPDADPPTATGAGSNFPYATEIVKKLNEEGKDGRDLKVEMAQTSNIMSRSCLHICILCVFICLGMKSFLRVF